MTSEFISLQKKKTVLNWLDNLANKNNPWSFWLYVSLDQWRVLELDAGRDDAAPALKKLLSGGGGGGGGDTCFLPQIKLRITDLFDKQASKSIRKNLEQGGGGVWSP